MRPTIDRFERKLKKYFRNERRKKGGSHVGEKTVEKNRPPDYQPVVGGPAIAVPRKQR